MEFLLSPASATRSGAAFAFFTSSSPFPQTSSFRHCFISLITQYHTSPQSHERNTLTMSNTRTSIPLTTNIRRVGGYNLDAEAGVVRCQFSVVATPKFIGQCNTSKGDTQLTATEEKAMYRVSLRRFVSDDSLLVKLSKNDVLATRIHGKPGVTRYLVVLTVFEGQNAPPVALQELDYSATFTHARSSGTEEGDDKASNAGHIETSTAPSDLKFDEWAKFKRSSLPTGHSSSSQRRYF
jgi:hypothetical protein